MLPRLIRFLSRLLPFTAAAALLAVLYLAWVVASRHAADEAISRARQQRMMRASAPPTESGAGLKLLQFYASSGEIVRGEHAIVCYGVENAAKVRLEPPVEEIAPALNKCFAVYPERTTSYRFFAEDAGGRTVSASFTINVKPPAARILELNLGKLEVRRGEAWAFCYHLKNAVKAVFQPFNLSLPPVKHCYQFYPPRTLKYTLLAVGEPGGGDDRYSWSIKVN